MNAQTNALTFACSLSLLLAGCASPHYGLKSEPTPPQLSTAARGVEIVSSPGKFAVVHVAADVSPILSCSYIVAAVEVDNASSNAMNVSSESFEIIASSPKGERHLAPIGSETLIPILAKQRASRERGRAWGAVIAAAASGHQTGQYSGMTSDGQLYSGSYSSTDTGEQLRVLNDRNEANRVQSEQESQLVRTIDRALFKPSLVQPGGSSRGLLVFPFSKSESYKLRATCGGETQELIYRLRTY
jgi:hypothetical protein